MDVYKPVSMLNIPPMRFIGNPTRQRRTGIIKGYWEPEISVAVTTIVGVLVEEALAKKGCDSYEVLWCGVMAKVAGKNMENPKRGSMVGLDN